MVITGRKSLIKSKHIRTVSFRFTKGCFYFCIGLYLSLWIICIFKIFFLLMAEYFQSIKGQISFCILLPPPKKGGGAYIGSYSIFYSLEVFKSTTFRTTPVRLRKEFKATSSSYFLPRVCRF